ncbi:MAG: Crp/Fnr family transcriptional regulator [Bacteroidales bacterium]
MNNNKEFFSGCTISLNRIDCFEKLSDEELSAMDSRSVVVTYKKGEMICKQGSFANHILYVVKGLVKVFMDDGVNSLVLKIISPGNFIGLSIISDENAVFQYSAKAYIDSEIKLIDINVFKQLLAANSAFSLDIISILSSNSLQINGRFFCLTHKQSYGRLADILICLSDRIFKNAEFDLPLSRKELAELSGMNPETVCRMLKKFHDDGLIQMEGKSFKIIDYPRLKRVCETG